MTVDCPKLGSENPLTTKWWTPKNILVLHNEWLGIGEPNNSVDEWGEPIDFTVEEILDMPVLSDEDLFETDEEFADLF